MGLFDVFFCRIGWQTAGLFLKHKPPLEDTSMLVLSRKASTRDERRRGDTRDSVALFDLEKFLLLVIVYRNGLSHLLRGDSPAQILFDASGLDSATLEALVADSTFAVRLVSARSGMARIGFDGPATTLVTRQELISALMEDSGLMHRTVLNGRNRLGWFASAFTMMLKAFRCTGHRSSRLGEVGRHSGLPAAG